MSGTIIVKAGGSLITDRESVDRLWAAIAQLQPENRVILVHGGGPRATDVARRLGHEPRVVHGRRVTTAIDLEIVKWTMRGELNVDLVARAQAHEIRAVGISGADGSTLQVMKRPPWTIDGERVDFGWVGDVQTVNTELLHALMDSGYVPVIAPLGIDPVGNLYNVNADTVSLAIASSLAADEYLLVTESGGVRRDASDAATHLSTISAPEYERGRSEGWISDGMIVKLKVAFEALDAGIPEVYVVSPDGILDRKLGTRIVA